MAYLLDANVFIQARKMHYGLDFCPAFWDWLDRENRAGRVLSLDKVREEIDVGGDELTDWAAGRRATMFLPLGAETLPTLATVATWVQGQAYSQGAINTFLQEVDYYLIGRALAHGDVLVTHELPAPASRNNIKIPDVCVGLGIRFTNPFAMLRTERASFVLAP
jgi:hypothetical protein